MKLPQIVDLRVYPLESPKFRAACKQSLEEQGVLVLPGFVSLPAIKAMVAEARANRDKVFAQTAQHTVYLSPVDPSYPRNHPRNRLVTSSKGCVTDDVIGSNSPLRTLYDAREFRGFLCDILNEEALYEYADPLSSINLHYAETGQELGWHFDNSSFSITLMVQPPTQGGQFEYVDDIRDADAGEMSFETVSDVLDGTHDVKHLAAEAGTLVVFRGRNSLHRVAPNEGRRTRILAVLAYNSAPGIALDEEARLTFYGRVD